MVKESEDNTNEFPVIEPEDNTNRFPAQETEDQHDKMRDNSEVYTVEIKSHYTGRVLFYIFLVVLSFLKESF